MCGRIRDKDWSLTPLGPAHVWPPKLVAAVDMILTSPIGMLVLWGPEFVQIYNDGYRDIMGAKHPAGLGQTNRECWPELWDFNRPIFECVLSGRTETFRDRRLMVERAGRPEDAWFDLTFSPLSSTDRAHRGVIVSVIEQTDRKSMEVALRSSERWLATAIAASSGGLFGHSIPVAEDLHLSHRWLGMLGLPSCPVRAETFEDWFAALIHPEDRPMRREAFAAFLAGELPRHDVELRLRHASGQWIWAREFALAAEHDHSGRVSRLSGMLLDISQQKAAEAKARHLARHDAFTGLPNRLLFSGRVEAALGPGAASRVGLVLMDLDRFKSINDSLGHHAGDTVLLEVAERLRRAVRPSDTAARIGGDEFAMVLPGLASRTDLERFTRRIRGAVVGPVNVDGRMLDVTASLGAAISPDDGASLESLMRHADLALYDAKRRGRDRVSIFHTGLAHAAENRVRVERELRRAIDGDDLLLHYQPQVDLASGRVTTVEALVRWVHKGELLLPGEFIGVAEASGAIRPLGAWVLSAACRQLAAWRADGLDLTVAVNVSPAEASDHAFTSSLDAATGSAAVPPDRLEFEITESLLFDPNNPAVRSFLRESSSRGIGLAIDDFGVGYSSLGYLAWLPITKVKIDRSFVSRIGDGCHDALIEAIVSLGHRLGHRVVAEGVETPEQFAFLLGIGCDGAQGSLIAAASAAAALEDVLRHGLLSEPRGGA